MFVYKIEIETPKSSTIKTFLTKIDAEKERRKLIKIHNLTRQRGFWGNPKTATELTRNY